MVNCRFAYRDEIRKWQINCRNQTCLRNRLHTDECMPSRCGYRQNRRSKQYSRKRRKSF